MNPPRGGVFIARYPGGEATVGFFRDGQPRPLGGSRPSIKSHPPKRSCYNGIGGGGKCDEGKKGQRDNGGPAATQKAHKGPPRKLVHAEGARRNSSGTRRLLPLEQ